MQNSIDKNIFNQVQKLMGHSYKNIYKLYLEETSKYLDIINQAIENLDIKATILPSHSIKSSSMQLGALKVGRFAEEIEILSINITEKNQGSKKYLLNLIHKISHEFNLVKQELNQIILKTNK